MYVLRKGSRSGDKIASMWLDCVLIQDINCFRQNLKIVLIYTMLTFIIQFKKYAFYPCIDVFLPSSLFKVSLKIHIMSQSLLC